MKKTASAAGMITAVVLLAGGVYLDDKNVIQSIDAEEQIRQETAAEENELFGQTDTVLSVPAGIRIAVVSKDVDGEFWEMIYEGMQAAVSEVNEANAFKSDDKITMTFEGPDNEQEVEEQVNVLDAVIAENPDVLCLSVGDMESCQAQIEAAAENGIPVVIFDSNVEDTQLIQAFRATDNIRVGEIAGQKLAEAVNQTGKIAVFSAQEKTESAQKRMDGFLSAVSEYEDIEIVSTIYMDQVEDMMLAISEVLQETPDLSGVFCTNADVADIYLDVEKPEDFSALLVGVDATTKQQDAIEDGKQVGVVSQNPYEMGYQTMIAAMQLAIPEEMRGDMEKNVLLEPKWIDASSLDNPQSATYLYE